jgi:hypothetical protein
MKRTAPRIAKKDTDEIIEPPAISPRIKWPAVMLMTSRRVKVIGQRKILISSVRAMATPKIRFPSPAGVRWELPIWGVIIIVCRKGADQKGRANERARTSWVVGVKT